MENIKMEDFLKLNAIHADLISLKTYENELQTMQAVCGTPKSTRQVMRKLYLEWMNSLVDESLSDAGRSKESNELREKGNKLFQEHQPLNASRLYTQAIFAAPPDSEALTLAYANRAMSLQSFGYYRQAYDDCVCALALHYPKKMQHKIITRQAYCAMKMGDVQLAQQHLETLQNLELNANFAKQLQQLQLDCDKLRCSNEKLPENGKTNALDEHRQTQKIVTSENKLYGRHIVAASTIKEDELIFNERATSFLPINNYQICQQCAATQLIPFPCSYCRCKVVYCSLKCRKAHEVTHAHECVAYQKNLFAYVGIAHLALRFVFDGMPQLVPLLHQQRNAAEIWHILTASDGTLLQRDDVEYVQTLRQVTHMDQMPLPDILVFAVITDLLLLYLRECTNFFNIYDAMQASRHDWELITGALILRHIGQLIVNGHTCTTIVRLRLDVENSLKFTLLEDNMWERPGHLRRGCLYQFSDYDEVTAANFPYLSICNHSCESSFQLKSSGNCVSTFATKPIQAGEEIFNCYTLDWRKSKRSTRQHDLKNTYRFKCTCEKCVMKNPDINYESFHRYRCVHCHYIFVPLFPNSDTLNWWDATMENIQCTKCQARQDWPMRYTKFCDLIKHCSDPTARQELFSIFEYFNKWLVDNNQLKMQLAIQVVTECYVAHNDGFRLSDAEFSQLANLVNIHLRGVIAKNHKNSIQYVVHMTFLWDFIALGKYKCTPTEMTEMLDAVKIVSDEMQEILMNYYNDFIVNALN